MDLITWSTCLYKAVIVPKYLTHDSVVIQTSQEMKHLDRGIRKEKLNFKDIRYEYGKCHNSEG